MESEENKKNQCMKMIENYPNIEVNEYQTPITEELFDGLSDKEIEEFFEFVTTIPYIQNLISPNRRRAKDMPHDEDGKVIIDYANPHILEDMDYFRPAALFYEKHGCYTLLKPNSNPNSEYRRFWDEERRRCRSGYVRPTDGEWVTGKYYFVLNYCPILLNKQIGNSRRANRVEGFPLVWEGAYLRFHYYEDSRNRGLHSVELSKRGAHPYYQKVYTPDGIKKWGDIKVGDKLFGTNGNITTVTDIPFDGIADIYKITLRDGRIVYASDDHIWNIKRHSNSKIMHVNTKYLYDHYINYREKSYRNPNGFECVYSIPCNKGVDYKYNQVGFDAYTLGVLLGDGSFRQPKLKNAIHFTSDSNDIKTYIDNIPYKIIKIGNDNYTYSIRVNNEYLKDSGLWMKKSEDKFIPNEYKFNSREIRLGILQGLMDTDGFVKIGGVPQFTTSSLRLANDVMEIARSLGYNCNIITKKAGYKKNGVYKKCLNNYNVAIYGGKELFRLERKRNIVDTKRQSRAFRTVITNIELIGADKCKCVSVDANDKSYLIGDYVQTHNCSKSISLAGFAAGNFILGINEEVTKLVKTFVVAAQSQYLDVSKDGTMAKFLPMINFIFDNTPFPHLMLKNSSHDGEWQMGYKDENNREKGSLNTVTAVSVKDDPDKLRGKRGDILFEEMGSFGNLLTVYNTSRSSVEEGDLTFGQIILVGTAGEDESDFSSAKTLLYNTEAHHIMSLKNVYDKPGQGKSTFGYFFPSYLNRPGCYNNNGVSDITKALVQVLMGRREARMSSNPRTVLKIIAEQPITPAEAIIKVKASYFPVIQLNERLLEIDTHPQILDSISVGDLYMDASGEVQFKQTNDLPIREYPVRNDNPGAIEIFEFPQKTNGKIISGRYIIGHDPVDNDSAESSSLTSTFVFDLFTDRIVAEYTGRRMFAEDNYEIVRLLCLFYNAQCLFESNKKGIYMYFSRMNCTYLLLDTPEHLREKGLIKYQAFGSNTKGVNANAIINAYANRLILDWMNKKNVIEYEDNGEYKVIETSNLYGIKSRALIMEAVAYRPEWNFDRIRALGMVMLAREEALILYGGNPASQQLEEETYTDPFFERNNPFKKNNNDSFFA